MNQKRANRARKGILILVLAVTLLLVGFLSGGTAAARSARSQARAAALQTSTLPAESCTYDGGTNTRTCELWATTGTLTLPDGATVPIWGYTDTSGGAAQMPGPAIVANQGEKVAVTLHNNLGVNTALVFPGQAMMPDLGGVADGGMKTYSFTATSPGTYLYEGGLLAGQQYQVAMGLYGALIVRPAANQAYGPDTTFDDEALLVLSEIDPALHNSADPAAFDMRDYKPRYRLINGRAYPDIAPIDTAAGNDVLLRFANAGVVQHAMSTLGVDQEVIALDGKPLDYSFRVAGATIGPGQTSDRMVTIPAEAGTQGTSRYPLYDGSMLLHNNGAPGFGGMLTFLTVADGDPPATGPTTTSVALAPNPTDGRVNVTLSATIGGDATITGAEYFVDTRGVDGTGVSMTASDGAFDSATEDVEATITTTDLALLTSGDHTIYVHGSDGTTWGAFNFAVLHLDKLGPATSGITMAPNPSNGNVDVAISATGDDTATGGSNIADAEYFIGAPGADGTGTSMTVNVAEPIASLDATIPAATMGSLPEGDHTVHVHSMDSFGWWGEFATATLVVDRTGPATSNVTAEPNPNNGAQPYSPTVYAIRVDALLADTASTIHQVEGFIDNIEADGSGFPLTPRDGLFNELTEEAYAYIPLSTIAQLDEGPHPIWIHGRDASGNWGAAVAVDLIIDKTAPNASDVTADPNPTGAAMSADLTATAADSATDIVAAEWFDGADPGPGNGTPMTAADGTFDSLTEDLTATIDVSTWAPGDHTISVRAQDAAGNWSAADTVILCVVKCNDIFADSFESGDFTAWSATTGSGISVDAAAAMAGGNYGMVADITGGPAGYVTDITPDGAETSYHARFYFSPNGADSQNNAAMTLFEGQNTDDTGIFRVEYRRRNARGGTYEVRAVALTAGGEQATGWVEINDFSANAVEIAWESGTAASFSLYVHGGLQETLTGLDTGAYLLDTVHLGPSGGDGLNGSASGQVYLDAFVSTRYTTIGQ